MAIEQGVSHKVVPDSDLNVRQNLCRSGGNDVTVSNRRQYRRQSFATSCIYIGS